MSTPTTLWSRSKAILFLLGIVTLTCAAQTKPAEPAPLQIDLGKIGYQGLAAQVRLSGDTHVSLDYLDSQHILLTYNPKKLFQRSPDCPPSHNDRMIHAAILELPSGNVVKETDWYLHDSRRYLWPLSSNKFLLRRWNKLYEVDSDFHEKLVLDSPQPLVWISVTPDGKQIITEISQNPAPAGDHTKSEQRVKISFIDTDSFAVQRVIESRGVVRMEAASTGYADAVHRGNLWLVRFGPASKDRVNVARVRTRATPDLLYTSENTILIGRCPVQRDDYSVSAFTLTGTVLWRQRWNSCRYHPAVKRSEDGSRFAAGTTIVPADTRSSAEESDVEPDIQQTIQVFDTATGNSLLSITADQPFMDAQNFGLSPDGRQMAIFAGRFLNIYSLREMSPEERKQYLAAKADAPGLYAPTGATDIQESVFISSSDEQSNGPQEGLDSSATASAKLEAPTTGAKQMAEQEAPALVIHTATKIVGLDVVVTDSKGNPVKGLQRADFSVTEDGKPQQLSQMAEYTQDQQQATPPTPASLEEKLPPNIFSNRSQVAESGSVTVVLFDLLNTPLPDQAYAQAELMKFLKNKPPDAQFALCTLSNRLQMFQGFTSDQKTLLAAVQSKGAMRHRQLLADDASPTLEAGRETARFLTNLDIFERSIQMQQAELRTAQADQRMYVTMDAFAQLARYLSGIPGRKNLVWLSGSFQLGLAPDPNGDAPYIQGTNYSDRVKQVTALMAEAHIAVYPVDVKGLTTNPIFSASTNDVLSPISAQGGFPSGPGSLTPDRLHRNPQTAVGAAVLQDKMEEFSASLAGERATMDKLASDTGGEAFYNTNGISRAITHASEQGSNYYALSYTPTNRKYDGKFRKIKVTLPGKYHLAYRRGYYGVDPNTAAKPAKDLMSSLARAAMQHGSPQSRQIVFGARVVPVGKPRMLKEDPAAHPAKKKEASVEMQRYAIEYAVTPTDLHFKQSTEGTYQGVFNFMVTTFDNNAKPGASLISQAVPNLKPESMRDVMLGGVRLHQEVDVPVNSTTMRLGVEDMANSHVGTLEIPLPVKPPPDAPVATHRSMPQVEPD